MLYEKLEKYSGSGIYPMHMPGHKRNMEFLTPGMSYNIDITEIHDFDNLQNPQGVLKEIAETAAGIYGSDKSYLLVNGSTVGILAAIGARAGYGGTIIMQRNCHMSVYNAAALSRLRPVYIMPGLDETTGLACSVDPVSVETALDLNKDVKLVVLTSPTYEGVISDISAIAQITNKRGVPLLVDEAHGAHLGFSERFPGEAVKAGADITVMSLHKTLPALTQCALIHIRGSLADIDEISRLLNVFQTSSPSYILMSSIDRCLRMLKTDSVRLFGDYERKLDRFFSETATLKKLSVFCNGSGVPNPSFFMFDPGKIVILTRKTGLTGLALADLLRTEYKIELEMACHDYALAMTSICDTEEGFSRLSEALRTIDMSLPESGGRPISAACPAPLPLQAEIPGSALRRNGRFVPFEDSADLMSLEYIWSYPPGIPVITPGEIISPEVISYISHMVRSGLTPKSTKGRFPLINVM